MKQSIYLVTTCVMAALTTTSAFTTPHAFTVHRTSSLSMAAELAPEPEGGTELSQVAVGAMEGSRMKNMGTPVDSDEKDGKKIAREVDGAEVFSFWLTADAEGDFVQKIRTKLLKEAGKNANFPGFRKGQVPPYAQPQMTMFAVQEGIIQTCQSSLDAYGLKAVPDEDGGSVEVLEDIKELVKGYKLGTNVAFTAKFVATLDPENRPAGGGEEAGVEGAIDVEVE